MLTISKSSKVGRYYNWLMEYFSGQGDYSRWNNMSLCKLCQNLFWRTLIVVALALLVGTGLSMIMYIVLAPLLSLFIKVDGFFIGYNIFIYSMILLVAGIQRLLQLRDALSNKRREPSLIAEWLKAKKQKVCPRINVTE